MADLRQLVPIALVWVAGACAGPAASGTPGRDPDRETVAAKVSGVGRVTLGLSVEVAGADSRRRRAIEAWFFEALAQSPWLDVDPSTPRDDAVVLRGELAADGGTLTTTYLTKHGPPVPLAGVRGVAGDNIVEAIDRLARVTRRTLGEPAPSIDAHARSAAALASRYESVAAACADARRLVASRRLAQADGVLRRALATDPACALALSLSAGVRMDEGRARAAVARANLVGRLPERASAAARHRAQRVLLLATHDYAGLVDLAGRDAAARPRDPQISFTKALGLCLLGRYDEAWPLLERLRPRLTDSPGVLFCLGHARLATGHAKEALALLPQIEAHVPALPAERLAAFILFALGKSDEVAHRLDRLSRRAEFRLPAGRLALLGMRAATALLRHDDAAAGRALVDQLDRLRAAPSILEARGDLLVDAAWVLTRIGRARDCAKLLAALRGPRGLPAPARAPGMAADAICRLAVGKKVSAVRLQHLVTVGLSDWSHRIEAAAAVAAGKPARALLLLEEATKQSRDPSLAYEYAEALAAAGRVAESNRLLAELAKDLAVPRMAEPGRHPLVRPKLALVYREALDRAAAKPRR